MYQVIKERGNNANVTLMVDSTSSIMIGKLSLKIMEVLEEEGYTFSIEKEGKPLKLTDEWRAEVTEETGKKLAAMAMTMKKPIRTKVNKTEEPKPKTEKKVIDAMDVLFGLAKYE